MTRMHPIQPTEPDALGVLRFKQNKIVSDLLEFSQERGFGLNEMARKDYSHEDRVQFAQLIGYSLGGFGELSYVSDSDYSAASLQSEQTADEAYRRGYTEGEASVLAKVKMSIDELSEDTNE